MTVVTSDGENGEERRIIEQNRNDGEMMANRLKCNSRTELYNSIPPLEPNPGVHAQDRWV